MARSLRLWFEGEAVDEPHEGDLRGGVVLPEDLLESETYEALRESVQNWGIDGDYAVPGIEALLGDCQRAFNVLQSREAYDIHEDWLERYGTLYDPAVKQRIERASEWTDADIEMAIQIREAVLGV